MAEDHSNNDIPENGADDDMDHVIENENEWEESFAAMFESDSAGMKENLRVGDKIEGRIIAISDSAVFVDTGTKADGVAEIEELKDEEGNLP